MDTTNCSPLSIRCATASANPRTTMPSKATPDEKCSTLRGEPKRRPGTTSSITSTGPRSTVSTRMMDPPMRASSSRTRVSAPANSVVTTGPSPRHLWVPITGTPTGPNRHAPPAGSNKPKNAAGLSKAPGHHQSMVPSAPTNAPEDRSPMGERAAMGRASPPPITPRSRRWPRADVHPGPHIRQCHQGDDPSMRYRAGKWAT